LALASKVARRTRQHGVTGKTITLKVKYSNFVQIVRSTTIAESTDDGPKIYTSVCRLLKKTDVGKRPVRLLGISLSRLSHHGSEGQLPLFNQDMETQKRKGLHTALDALQEKFGEKSIRPGTLVDE
jgi:DNA polymerase-4